ncbi:MAG: GNAT family N-acetyltransferase [Thermomicrobiales bacterium]
MSSFEIRVAESLSESEIEQLSSILIAVVEAGASVRYIAPLEAGVAASYWRNVISDDHVLFLAERDNIDHWYAQLELAMRANGIHRAEVCKVLVHPEAQGQGIGSRLMHAIDAEARRLGRSTLHLDTRRKRSG